MLRAILFPISILAMLIGLNDAQNPQCDYYQELEPGQSYYVYNSGYPGSYTGQNYCRWVAQSSYRNKLTCTVFQLPASQGCSQDVLTVKINNGDPYKYCGTGTFSIESESKLMEIRFYSPSTTTGGKFLCLLQAIEEEQESNDCACGKKNPNKIVGGQETGVNEYPMMAGLVDASIKMLYCGAGIIAPRYVLTAAHCVTGRNVAQLGVIAGEHDLSTGSESNATKLYRISKAIVHPNYVSVTTGSDIAIIQIDGVFTYSNAVGPACLPFQHSFDSFAGDFVKLLGWGSTEYGGATTNTLQEVSVSVLTYNQCKTFYPNGTSSQLCTYARSKDACQFDSGGPVLWENPTTRQLLLIAVISYGRVCGADSPGVNTRVGSYIDWIVSETSEVSYCQSQ
ncbi:venom serine protease 34-like [Prorops nasuta]|uniref:venom serine protease 34-like n=1 Tax=Prorops nasuta TaxID=863751 RepID=UPI0034CE5389